MGGRLSRVLCTQRAGLPLGSLAHSRHGVLLAICICQRSGRWTRHAPETEGERVQQRFGLWCWHGAGIVAVGVGMGWAALVRSLQPPHWQDGWQHGHATAPQPPLAGVKVRSGLLQGAERGGEGYGWQRAGMGMWKGNHHLGAGLGSGRQWVQRKGRWREKGEEAAMWSRAAPGDA